MIFDFNLAVGAWPFRPLSPARPAALHELLLAAGVTGGLVRRFEAAFYDDLAAANRLLAADMAELPGFIPGYAVRPDYGFWRELAGAKAAVLCPSFHGYDLNDAATLEMAEALAAAGTVLVVVMREEDERNQNPQFRLPGLPAAAVDEFARRLQPAPVVALGAYYSDAVAFAAPNLHVEISLLEAFRTMRTVLAHLPAGRLLFGSHAPFLVQAAAAAKLRDDGLPPELTAAIEYGNAHRLFGLPGAMAAEMACWQENPVELTTPAEAKELVHGETGD